MAFTDLDFTALEVLTAAQLDQLMANIKQMSERSLLLVNGNFDIWQEGTSFTAATTPANNDDTYFADQWILLSDGNDVVDIAQETASVPDGSRYAAKFTVATINKKFAIAQPIEANLAMALANKTVSLRFQAHTTSGQVRNLRAAILSWNSTADAITSDVVSAWGAEGTEPTWAANWTREGAAPVDLAITNAWAQYGVDGIALDTASLANLMLVIWSDDGDLALNDELYIGQVSLQVGSVITDIPVADPALEQKRCERYFRYIQMGWQGSATIGLGYQGFASWPAMLKAPILAWVSDNGQTSFGTGSLAGSTVDGPEGGRANKTATVTDTDAYWSSKVSLTARL